MRQIACIVLNRLACEVVEGKAQLSSEHGANPKALPLAVTVPQTDASKPEAALGLSSWSLDLWRRAVLAPAANRTIWSVNERAALLGIKPGQTAAEACAKVAQLRVASVSAEQLQAALERVADCVASFGTTVALELPDTVWVDISGVGHLYGGATALLREMAETVCELGHQVRIVASRGARLSQALARWGSAVRTTGTLVVSDSELEAAVNDLPIPALPVESEVRIWLAQLGILSLGELARIPMALSAGRLGRFARTALDTLRGCDEEPLRAFSSALTLVEQVTWEHAVAGIEPLRFSVRRLMHVLAKRLQGRALATHRIRYEVIVEQPYQERTDCEKTSPQQAAEAANLRGECELASPLSQESELTRVLVARLSQLKWRGAAWGIRLELTRLVPAPARQLRLDFDNSGVSFDRIAHWDVLNEELAAELGRERVGTLATVDTHLLERRGRLVPLENVAPTKGVKKAARKRTTQSVAKTALAYTGRKRQEVPFPLEGPSLKVREVSDATEALWVPTRVFEPPIPIYGAIRSGGIVALGGVTYTVKACQFERRVDAVEWWSGHRVSRDYVRAWLGNASDNCVAIVCVDRVSMERSVFALCD